MSRRATAGGVAVLGARPNFVKLLPVWRAVRERGLDLPWIHTGQHGHWALDEAMRRDLRLPAPRLRLRAPGPGPGRVAEMARRLRAPLAAFPPGWVLGFGDVDSTAAAALCARDLGRPFVHVEAGLRADDPTMAEERNRVLADHLGARLYAPESAAARRLVEEGIPPARVRTPGNVMADALEHMREAIERRRIAYLRRGLTRDTYVLLTLHRQANVDPPRRRAAFLKGVALLARTFPVTWPLHPRLIRAMGAAARRTLQRAGVRLLPPQPYLDFLALVHGATLVATDSGGLQVEAALLGVPCLILRDRTEHRLTLDLPTHRLLGPDPRAFALAAYDLMGGPRPVPPRPRAWDGRAAQRLVADLLARPPRRPVGGVRLPRGFRLPRPAAGPGPLPAPPRGRSRRPT